mmetsp:Transcript_14232/g.26366  ORF Transcript_14232/g.26366 Transcript_14232/m.26366 type:complete len:176 (-) Transcript_14232:249-776(-)
MGAEQSQEVPLGDEAYEEFVGDEEEELDDEEGWEDHDYEEYKEEEDLQEGFNMIFSPELVERLQSDGSSSPQAEAGAREEATPEQMRAMYEQREQQMAREQAAQIRALAVEEERSLRELDQLLGSLPTPPSEKPKATEVKCSAESEACKTCMLSGDITACSDAIEAFDKCVRETK